MHHGEFLRLESRDDHLVYHLSRDWRRAALSAQDTAMLEYAEKLTRDPAAMGEDDVRGLREVGFDDRQVLDIVLVCALFNFMTRLADGIGLRAEETFRAVKTRKDAQVEAELARAASA